MTHPAENDAPVYAMVYRCSECGWFTQHYAEIDGHEYQLEPGHLVAGQMERVRPPAEGDQ